MTPNIYIVMSIFPIRNLLVSGAFMAFKVDTALEVKSDLIFEISNRCSDNVAIFQPKSIGS